MEATQRLAARRNAIIAAKTDAKVSRTRAAHLKKEVRATCLTTTWNVDGFTRFPTGIFLSFWLNGSGIESRLAFKAFSSGQILQREKIQLLFSIMGAMNFPFFIFLANPSPPTSPFPPSVTKKIHDFQHAPQQVFFWKQHRLQGWGGERSLFFQLRKSRLSFSEYFFFSNRISLQVLKSNPSA